MPQSGSVKSERRVSLLLSKSFFTTTPASPFSSRHPSMDGVPLQSERRGSVRTGPAEDPGEMRLCIEKLKVEGEASFGKILSQIMR